MKGQALSWSKVGETLEVNLHRSPCNELGLVALAELEKLAAFVQNGADGARALLFYSTIDKGFCAGADLRELYAGLSARGNRADSTTQVREFLDRIHNVFNIIDAAPLTTVAAVHGFCFGGGFELALICDVIVADKSARFAFPELRLGLVPGFGGIPRLKRDLGNALVRDLLLTGRSINATKAHQVGLVSQVVGRGNALRAARGVTEQAARFHPGTTAAAKEFVKPIPREELEREKDIFMSLFSSPVVEAALKKFVQSEDVRPYLP